MLRDFLKLRFYLVVGLLFLGGFVWAGLTGRRLLGDDNESTENINAYGGHSGGRGGSARYFHK